MTSDDLRGPGPIDGSCEVSGGTTTAAGAVPGPATVTLVVPAQDSAGKIVGGRGRLTVSAPAGHTRNWNIGIDTAGVTPARCIVDSDGADGGF
jgi:hypothetical protein